MSRTPSSARLLLSCASAEVKGESSEVLCSCGKEAVARVTERSSHPSVPEVVKAAN